MLGKYIDLLLYVTQYFASFSLALYLTWYKVVVKTGTVDGADTDANVYIRINGTTGYIEREIDGPGNDFEEGR